MTTDTTTSNPCPSWCEGEDLCELGDYDDRPLAMHHRCVYSDDQLVVWIDGYEVAEGFIDPPGIRFVRGRGSDLEAMHWLTADEATRLGEQLQVAGAKLRAIEAEGFGVLP